MEKEILFYLDLYWVKIRAKIRGQLELCERTRTALPAIGRGGYCKMLERLGRLR
jgi:hypothetical protein